MDTPKTPTPSPITGARPIHCPACKVIIAEVTTDGVTVFTPDTYLTDDADTIPGAPREMLGMASMALAGVGQCPECGSPFWTLEFYLDPGGEAALIEHLEEDHPWDAAYSVYSELGVSWSAHRYSGKASSGWSHVIGPLPVPPGTQTHGRNGVSSCRGGGFWNHARSVLDELLPQIAGAQSQL